MKAGLEAGLHHDRRTGQAVAELERELGRKAQPFSLELVVLPEYFGILGMRDTDKVGVREADGDDRPRLVVREEVDGVAGPRRAGRRRRWPW